MTIPKIITERKTIYEKIDLSLEELKSAIAQTQSREQEIKKKALARENNRNS